MSSQSGITEEVDRLYGFRASENRRSAYTPVQCGNVIETRIRTILILASNPTDQGRLRLGREVSEIEEGLRRSKYRERFVIEQRWAINPTGWHRAMLDLEPEIVHFCGHGSGVDGLVLEDRKGRSQLTRSDALARLFHFFADRVECVVLNACLSHVQAQAISMHIKYVVGMSQTIGDEAAIQFSKGFYDALGAGRSYPVAYDFGCSAIDMQGIPEQLTPKLFVK
ncbi:MAG: CHAT domain-containing protein [Candidatus Electrothrix sp. LOE1_4_5]|nr:CHAT domain-containing protein [Candidatus Electrothrix gigas]